MFLRPRFWGGERASAETVGSLHSCIFCYEVSVNVACCLDITLPLWLQCLPLLSTKGADRTFHQPCCFRWNILVDTDPKSLPFLGSIDPELWSVDQPFPPPKEDFSDFSLWFSLILFLLIWYHLLSFFLLTYLLNLFLTVLSLHCCMWAFSRGREWGPLFVVVPRLLIVVASFLARQGL